MQDQIFSPDTDLISVSSFPSTMIFVFHKGLLSTILGTNFDFVVC